MRKITIAGFVAAALIAGACASGTSVEEDTAVTAGGGGTTAAEGSRPAATTAKIGGSLTVKASGITATWTLGKVERKDADQFGSAPDNGGQWVLVYVKVAVKQGRETFVCACDLSIISKTGKVYESTYASFKGHPDLTGTQVAPGQNTDGWVIFGVAKADLAGARLQLQQQSLFDDTAFGYWSL